MGKKGRQKRKKSSESDTDVQTKKQSKHGAKTDCEPSELSDVISEANGVLYNRIKDSELDSDSDQEKGTNLSVFSTPRQKLTSTEGTTFDSPEMASPKCSDSEKLDTLIKAVNDLKSSQDGMKKMFERKLDSMRNELMDNIDNKVKSLRDELSLEMGKETSRVDAILTTVHSLQSRLDTMDQTAAGQSGANMDTINGTSENQDTNGQGQQRFRPGHSDDTDISVVVSGVIFEDGEDLLNKAQGIINTIGENVSSRVKINRVIRFRTHYEGRPGLVKITFRNLNEKVLVLRNKMKLKDSQDYREVYVKSCKSHAERIIEMNARALLRQLPQGHNFRVDANGRIIRRTRQEVNQNTD